MSGLREQAAAGSCFPLGGSKAQDGRATATCYCGQVVIEFPIKGEDLVDTFLCNCADCRKITASMFASNFIVNESGTKFIKGKDTLKQFRQSKTIDSGNTMENNFCSNCGTLMYRVSSGFPGKLIPRIGTIDDFGVQERELKPRIEQFVKDRVGWLNGATGVEQHDGNFYAPKK